jgi:DNA polymerase-3 subunit gamma/tau
MSEYVVSARKYRPNSFDEVVGQEHISKTLLNQMESGHLAQAFLFCGPRGVGKTTCARILAKELNRGHLEDDADLSFNIFELDAASNNSVDDIRALIEQVRIPPAKGKYKAYIIDEVHMLSTAAFNAFLKTLEEPPEYAIFILATTEKHKVLPTILSRCQVFTFERISVEMMVKHLQHIAKEEGVTVDEDALYIIGQKADGALRDALSIFDQMISFASDNHVTYNQVIKNLNVLDYEYYFKMAGALNEGTINDVFVQFDSILKAGFDSHLFLIGLANHFRDLLVAKDANTLSLLEVPAGVVEQYQKQGLAISNAFLINAINIAGQADVHYKMSQNKRLHVETMLIKMAHINTMIDLTQSSKKKVSP